MPGPRERLAVAAHDWFSELPPKVVAQIAALSRTRRFGDGQLIHAKGDAPDGLYNVRTGRVRISTVAADGKELLSLLFDPGGWFGDVSMFDGLPRTHSAHAMGVTEILFLPRTSLLALLARQPTLYPHFLRMQSRKLRLAFEYIEQSTFLSLTERLSQRLLLLGQLYGQQSVDGLRINLSHQDIAQMLGVSRQRVSKELKVLEAQGRILLKYGQLVLRQPATLSASRK